MFGRGCLFRLCALPKIPILSLSWAAFLIGAQITIGWWKDWWSVLSLHDRIGHGKQAGWCSQTEWLVQNGNVLKPGMACFRLLNTFIPKGRPPQCNVQNMSSSYGMRLASTKLPDHEAAILPCGKLKKCHGGKKRWRGASSALQPKLAIMPDLKRKVNPTP